MLALDVFREKEAKEQTQQLFLEAHPDKGIYRIPFFKSPKSRLLFKMIFNYHDKKMTFNII